MAGFGLRQVPEVNEHMITRSGMRRGNTQTRLQFHSFSVRQKHSPQPNPGRFVSRFSQGRYPSYEELAEKCLLRSAYFKALVKKSCLKKGWLIRVQVGG